MMEKQDKKPPAEGGGEIYYMENGEKRDEAIHESILAEGDEDMAREASIEVMVELGFSREEAIAFLTGKGEEEEAKGDSDVIRRQRMQAERERAERLLDGGKR